MSVSLWPLRCQASRTDGGQSRVTTINHTGLPPNRLPARHACPSHKIKQSPITSVLIVHYLLFPHSGLWEIWGIQGILVVCILQKETTAFFQKKVVIISSSCMISLVCIFVQLCGITCSLFSSSYMISPFCFFRLVTWNHMIMYGPCIFLQYICCSSYNFVTAGRVEQYAQ